MKKLKFLALLAMMLIAATLLCACGNLANLNKVFNEAFDTKEKLFTKAEEIADLEQYSLTASNSEFAVFAKTLDDGFTAYKIYNFRKAALVETYPNSKDTTYKISLLEGIPAYCVEKESGETTSKAYYDAAGNKFAEVENVDKEISGAKKLNDKLAMINAVLYEIDQAEGKLEEKDAVPAYVSYNNITKANDEYFYALGNTVIIYNVDFEPVAVWTAPSYAKNLSTFVMNNGAVLVQYSVVLDEDAKKFDYYDNGDKYDLVSFVLSTKGAVNNAKLDYVVKQLVPNYDLYDENLEKEENVYTDKFENLAVIARIENQLIDTNSVNFDFVLMNNAGKAQKSLKLVDGQIGIPERISEDLFVVQTVYGEAIVNEKGKVQFAVTEGNVKYFGGYIVVEGRAIYNLEFEVIYDLIEKDAEIAGYEGDTVFVKAGEKKDEKYEILAFVNGSDEPESILTWDKTVESNKEFAVVDGVGYSIYDPKEKTYTYYAADTTELLTVKGAIAFVASGDNGKVAIYKAVEDGVTKFYAFTKDAEK